jgi:hypothetical protein
MNAPWIADMRYYEEMDAREQRDYAIERLSAHIASDPETLVIALADSDEESPTLLNLAALLCQVWKGEHLTPEQHIVMAACVQGLADDHAKALYDCADD